MLSVYAGSIDTGDPLSGLVIGETDSPEPPRDWVPIRVKAAALNHHDLWALQGVALKVEQLPMILGTDAAGVDPEGREVIVHSVIGDRDAGDGDETLDPKRTLLSEQHPGTMAETVHVPVGNVVPKPSVLSWAEAACLPTSWLTAWRMLTTRGGLVPRHQTMSQRDLPSSGKTAPKQEEWSPPGDQQNDVAVLIQGAGGGVSTAATLLALAFGARVYVTSRSAAKRERVAALGATACESGARLPERVDLVIETVGNATLDHSIKSTRPGGRVVVAGATSGFDISIDMRHVYFRQIQLLGSTMGTVDELTSLAQFCADTGTRPLIDSTYSFADARAAFERLQSGDAFGKIVLEF